MIKRRGFSEKNVCLGSSLFPVLVGILQAGNLETAFRFPDKNDIIKPSKANRSNQKRRAVIMRRYLKTGSYGNGGGHGVFPGRLRRFK